MKYYLIKLHREPTKYTRIKEGTFVELTEKELGNIDWSLSSGYVDNKKLRSKIRKVLDNELSNT